MDRRTVLGLGAIAFAGLSARAGAGQGNPESGLAADPKEIVPLWPDAQILPERFSPGLDAGMIDRSTDPSRYRDRYVSGVLRPTLAVFRPDRPDGSGIVIMPGGSYETLALDKEGYEIARWLNAFGITAFVLSYRLPHEGWWDGANVPLTDAQRAMKIVRAGAQGYAIDPARLGALGFSAGAHLAGSLATRPYDHLRAPSDAIDMLDAKPAFAGLLYPVVTMGVYGHQLSRLRLLGAKPSSTLVGAYSVNDQVGPHTGPLFVALAADDEEVRPVENGVALNSQMIHDKQPIEFHVFQSGGHGFALRFAKGSAVSEWPRLFLHWGGRNGWFRDPGVANV